MREWEYILLGFIYLYIDIFWFRVFIDGRRLVCMERMGKMVPRRRESGVEEKGLSGSDGVIFVLKCLLGAYVLTAGFLLLLALMLYRFGLEEKVVNICIIGIYVVVTFLAGWLAGKRAGTKKFVWGLLMGIAYFVVLAIVSLVVNGSVQDVASNFVTVFLLCAGSGMLGGMVS